MHVCGRFNRIFVLVNVIWADFGQELFGKACHAIEISRTKRENWVWIDFERGLIQLVQSMENGF